MASLPADRTKLALAQGNQVPNMVIASAKNINAIIEVYDTIDLLNQKVDTNYGTGAIGTNQLATDSVTLAKMADSSVGTTELVNASVTLAKMAAASVGTTQLIDGSVTGAKIASSSVGSSQLDPILLTNFGDIAVQAEFDRRGIDVKKYGAVGGGVTDDTAAIQAALTALVAGSGELILPSGTYNVSTALTATILAGKQIKIRGIGRVIIQSTVPDPAAYNTTGVFTLTGTTTSSLIIENIDIEHTYASSNRGQLQGMRLNTFQNVILENVTVNNVSDIGIQLCNVNGGYANNCYCTNNNYAGLAIQGTIDFTVNDGQYNTNGGNNSGTTEGYGITCETADPVLLVNNERIIIQGVKAFNNVGKGIDAHNCLVLTIQNCHIQGFLYSGIYAGNESATKAVSDVKILDNFIDGGTMTVAGQGIRAGSFGATQTIAFGTLEIIGNTIKNINFSLSDGILVDNADTGGISPSKVMVSKNIMKNASPVDGYIIRSNNYAVPITNMIVSDNIIHAVSCSVAIGLNTVTTATIEGNIITVDSGTVAQGINTSLTCHTIITNNQLEGSATYTSPLIVYTGQIAKSNTLLGVLINDDVMRFGDTADQGKKIQTSTTTVTIPSGTKIGTGVAVIFAVAFSATPIVLADIQNANATANAENPITVFVYSRSTTGFNISLYATANVAADRVMTIGWMAIG